MADLRTIIFVEACMQFIIFSLQQLLKSSKLKQVFKTFYAEGC
jgi:hypothetical protein